MQSMFEASQNKEPFGFNCKVKIKITTEGPPEAPGVHTGSAAGWVWAISYPHLCDAAPAKPCFCTLTHRSCCVFTHCMTLGLRIALMRVKAEAGR